MSCFTFRNLFSCFQNEELPSVELPPCLVLENRVENQRIRGDTFLSRTNETAEGFVRQIDWDTVGLTQVNSTYPCTSTDINYESNVDPQICKHTGLLSRCSRRMTMQMRMIQHESGLHHQEDDDSDRPQMEQPTAFLVYQFGIMNIAKRIRKDEDDDDQDQNKPSVRLMLQRSSFHSHHLHLLKSETKAANDEQQ